MADQAIIIKYMYKVYNTHRTNNGRSMTSAGMYASAAYAGSWDHINLQFVVCKVLDIAGFVVCKVLGQKVCNAVRMHVTV